MGPTSNLSPNFLSRAQASDLITAPVYRVCFSSSPEHKEHIMFLDGETKMLQCKGSAQCKSPGCHMQIDISGLPKER